MSSAVGSSTAPSKVPRKSSAATTSAAILGEASALVQRQRAKGESGLVKNEGGGGEGILYTQKVIASTLKNLLDDRWLRWHCSWECESVRLKHWMC